MTRIVPRPIEPISGRALRRVALGLATAGLALVGRPAEAPAQVPGLESFSKVPKTPVEFWEVSDYLIRVGQPKAAVPFLQKFAAANPDDATLFRLRDEYGQASFFRLRDDPSTRPFAEPLLSRLADATRKVATAPARLDAAIAALSRPIDERRYAVERLREAGPYGVPPIVRALGKDGIAPVERRALIDGLGALDASAVPPLVATLDSPDGPTSAAAAEALGLLGDERAVPPLTALAARPDGPARGVARAAIARITGVPFASQPSPPVRTLVQAARGAHLSIPRLPNDPATAWGWDDAAKAPAPRATTQPMLVSDGGIRLARAAVALAPADPAARAVLLALTLERDPAGATPEAVAAGPAVLGEVVRRAIADGRNALAVAAIGALSRANPADALGVDGRPSALVEALAAPDRRVQFAAAEAVVNLGPRRPFRGSSRVVPALARFVAAGPLPVAVVIDGNPARGSQTVGFLKTLGYDAQLVTAGDQGFRLAAESADVELIAIDPDLVQGPWRLVDTLANLRADAHTAGIPVFLVGPLSLRDRYASKLASFPRVRFLVTPTESALFKDQIDRGLAASRARPLSAGERVEYAKRSTALLARIATAPGNLFEADLAAAGPALEIALNAPTTGVAAVAALGDIPRADAQRGLADAVLTSSNPLDLRLAAAAGLERSLRRFGALLSPDQEADLLALLGSEPNPEARAALAKAVVELRPEPVGRPRAARPALPRPASRPR